jgi:hypothetical protein
MPQIVYSLQFRGQVALGSSSPKTLKETTTALSCRLTTIVGPDGLRGALEPVEGDDALLESEVVPTGETSFRESGTITFGEGGHALRFSTVSDGYLAPSSDPSIKHGCAIWKIDGGEGQFANASGLITSNFTVGESGDVVDHQCGVIFLE